MFLIACFIGFALVATVDPDGKHSAKIMRMAFPSFTETDNDKLLVDDQVHWTTSELKTALSGCLLLAEQYNDEAM